MSFKKTSTNVLIKVLCEMIIQVLYSVIWFWTLRTIINTLSKQIREPLQRVLIHRINYGQINDCKEENWSPVSNRSVNFSGLIDLFLGNLRLFHSDIDFIRSLFRLFQNFNKLIIFKNVCNLSILGQSNKDLVFNFSQNLGRLGVLLDNVILLLLKIWHFLRHELIEHLLFKTERSNGEVENGNLHWSLGWIVRVGNGCCHEEFEGVVPRNTLISKLKRACLINLLQKNRLKSGIKLLTYVFDKNPSTELNTKLKIS